MEVRTKCQFGPCDCKALIEQSYCSKDCEGAAVQGVERDFCQCAHSKCSSSYKREIIAYDLSETSALREITVAYTDRDNLIAQLMDLASALLAGKEEVLLSLASPHADRHPARSESAGQLAKSQSA